MNISFSWDFGGFIKSSCEYDTLIEECSKLYSGHYGEWGSIAGNEKAGKNVRLNAKRLNEWLASDKSSIYWAEDDGKVIGYAIAIQVEYPKHGTISWVTQLVVHKDYRNMGIAKDLLTTIWGFSDDFAWGIVSANPFAIRALEKTTRRRAIPLRIKNNIAKILSVGEENIPYINHSMEVLVNDETSQINTQFFIDHSEIENMISKVVTENTPWNLGHLDEGWEWLAFTFRDQIPFELEKTEIEHLLSTSDQVAQKAYERMDYSAHPWAKQTEKEVQFIISECGLKPGDSVIDFGCGTGRHAILLAQMGINVVGVDYVNKHIKEAIKNAESKKLKNVRFIHGDCRTINLEKADAVICLYDVIGSYVSIENNMSILGNISKHLKSTGTAIISVMNYELTSAQAKYKFSIDKNPNDLLKLKPSTIQENNGNVFDPEYYMLEMDTPGVVYRREQFRSGRTLPIELIVRDRRFTRTEIENMCCSARLNVAFSRYVNAGNWDIERAPTETAAKEILIKCKK